MHSLMDKPHPVEPDAIVACEVCLSEIPGSVACSAEGPDYVHHFCGIECFNAWRRLVDELFGETS